jgi:type II secretory pathway predicted ATPase ExeA
MLKKISVVFLLCLVATAVAYGITEEDLYNRAAQKYITGDMAGAESDLVRVLELNPRHERARELLGEVRRELGRTAPAVPAAVVTTTTVAAPPPAARPTFIPMPAPAPRPTVPSRVQKAGDLLAEGEKYFEKGEYEIARKYFLEVLELMPGHTKAEDYLKQIKEKTKVAPPKFVPQEIPSTRVAGMEETLRQLFYILGALALVAVYVLARWGYFIVKKHLAEKRMQVCPDCRTKNPEEAEFCQKCGTRLKAWSAISGMKKKWFDKFGWKRNPFTLDVIPALFTGYSSQVNAIIDKLSSRSGHVLVYGGKGVGKTTLLRWLADNLKQDNHAIYVARPPINFEDLLNFIVLDLKGKGQKGKYSLYELEELVKKAKKPVVMLIDEAHEVTPEIEQQMRSLGDIHGVNLVLAGLPETREKIKRESPPLFDRIVLETSIDHLTLEETRDLIKKRVEDAGGQDVKPFTNEAIENIFKMSKGRPRMILKVCDWVLADAIKNNLEVIGAEMGKDFPKHDLEEGAPVQKPEEKPAEPPQS